MENIRFLPENRERGNAVTRGHGDGSPRHRLERSKVAHGTPGRGCLGGSGEPLVSSESLFVDGQWRNGSAAEVFEVINPATGEVVRELTLASAADLDTALAA